MKNALQDQLQLAPKEERAILDEIRNDRELVARLKITPQELEALSKCALLGTLTCKQDMLFILRQIREATGPGVDQPPVFPQPSHDDEENERPLPDLHRIRARIAPAIAIESTPLDTIVRRRVPEQVGVLFWVVILIAGLLWNGIIVMSHWRDTFMTSIGNPVGQPLASDEWLSHLDRSSYLLGWEALFVALIVGFTYLRSLRNSRRFRVKPGRRFN
jgi:hypothetical protein